MKKRILLSLLLAVYLGTHNGYLALLQRGNPNPLSNYQLPVAMLPPLDQAILARGIEIKDELHLAQLLEDYLS